MKRYEKFFAAEIGVEFKAALYFYSILFFYMGFRFLGGNTQAELLHLLEMVGCTYVMGFVQVFVLDCYDESAKLSSSSAVKTLLVSLAYAAVSWLLGWFERSVPVTVLFFCFVIVCHGCTMWLYSFRRRVSTEQLNRELESYKQRNYRHTEEEKQ